MKIKHLLPVLALGLPLAIGAKPAYPGLINKQNPDGTKVEVRLHGDELFSYVTDATNSNILEKDSRGYWVQAVRGGVALKNVAADVEMLRSEWDEQNSNDAVRLGMQKNATLGSDGRSIFPSVGTDLKFLVIVMEYSDVKFTMDDPQAFYTNWLNQENFQFQDLNNSVRDYYIKSSNGNFAPTFVVAPKVSLPYTSAYYASGSFSNAIKYALDTLDSNGFDFTQFDMDSDGKIDNIYFFYAGYGAADSPLDRTQVIWPHKSDLSSYYWRYDGKLFGPYSTSNELRGSHYYTGDNAIDGIGTFSHEFGHVLGLPDLYDPNYASSTDAILPGDWTVMCNGTYNDDGRTPPVYTGYESWACRWLEYEDITENTHYTLEPFTTTPRAIKISIPRLNSTNPLANEYFILENHAQQGWDTYIPGEGLLIWHIDFSTSVWTSNRVNSDATHPRCTIVTPPNCTVALGNWPQSGVYTKFIAPDYPNALTAFGRADTSKFLPYILNIKHDSETKALTFDYNLEGAGPYTNVHQEGQVSVSRDDEQLGFNMSWDALTDASQYIVTVRRYNSSGSSFTVDGYNSRLMDEGVVSGIVHESSAMMVQEHEIEIRPVAAGTGLPSTNTYVTARFIPAELSAVNGVEIETVKVTTGKGFIDAPQGAKIYNMAGMKVGSQNLPAGVYIVNLGNQTLKVIVK